MRKELRVGKASVWSQRWLAGLAAVTAPLISAWLAVALLVLVEACAADTSQPRTDGSDRITAQVGNDGAVRTISIPDPSGDVASAESEKSGCTHIRFCTEPGTSDVIVCDTNDKQCTSTARYNECLSDAHAVCGRTRPMVFDPAIPCPVTGVCSAGDTLFSIGLP